MDTSKGRGIAETRIIARAFDVPVAQSDTMRINVHSEHLGHVQQLSKNAQDSISVSLLLPASNWFIKTLPESNLDMRSRED